MTVDTERLRQLAAAATPGPWVADGDLVTATDGPHPHKICGGDQCNFLIERDAAFIAAANPATVLALLDEVDKLTIERNESELGRLEVVADLRDAHAVSDRAHGLLREAVNALDESSAADSHAELVRQCRDALAVWMRLE